MRKLARSLKGGLIYIVQAHPGIAHAVSRVCAFMAKPTVDSYSAAKRILAWLRDRADLGVTYGRPDLLSLDDLIPTGDDCKPMDGARSHALSCCVDSDLNGRTLPTPEEQAERPADPRASRSQLGYEFSLGGATFEAVSRRQASVALDTAAAELFAATTAAAHLINVTGVLRFVTFGVLGSQPVSLWCDNEVCVAVGQVCRFHEEGGIRCASRATSTRARGPCHASAEGVRHEQPGRSPHEASYEGDLPALRCSHLRMQRGRFVIYCTTTTGFTSLAVVRRESVTSLRSPQGGVSRLI